MLIALHGPFGSGKNAAGEILAEEDFLQIAFADKLRELLLILNPIVSMYEVWRPQTPQVDGDYVQTPLTLQQAINGPAPEGLLWHQKTKFGLGWDRAKEQYPEVRRLQQVFATDVVREHIQTNYWVDVVQRFIDEHPGRDVVITDLRFPNEYEMVQHFNGHTWVIERPGHEYPAKVDASGHVSETWHPPGEDSWILTNDGDLDELRHTTRLLLTSTRSLV